MSEASPAHYSDEERALLKRFVTDTTSNIYCIRDLPPEVTAVLFAYVSRSAASFRANLLKLLQAGDLEVAALPSQDADADDFTAASEKARKFHEKWVVGYGHASVAEHADIKFAIEDVSILASKVLEDNRLAAYTEKSTRYQVFSPDRYYTPERVANGPHAQRYRDFLTHLFSRYIAFTEQLTEALKQDFPQQDGVSPRAYRSTINAKACDIARYLLPAATYTAIGMSVNARVAAHAINKLLSHPLPEMHSIGAKMLEEGRKICPALLKYVGEKPFLRHNFELPRKLLAELPAPGPTTGDTAQTAEQNFLHCPTTLQCLTPDPEATIVAALLHPAGNASFDAILAEVRTWPMEKIEAILNQSVEGMGDFDWPSRAFERVVFRSEILVDYGAYRDIQRHRIATQTAQPLGVEHGYETPPQLEKYGLAEEYHELMALAARTYHEIARDLPDEAQYVVPFAYRIRVLFDWNLRQLCHFVRLRSGREGHISYRTVAQKLYVALREQHPVLAPFLRPDLGEYDLERLEGELKLDRKLAAAQQPK